MIEKVMGLIELATQFKGTSITVTVNYCSSVNGVYVYIQDRKSRETIYSKESYLDWEGTEERLDKVKAELERLLKEVA